MCDLTQPMGRGQPTVSRHLKVLVVAETSAGHLQPTAREVAENPSG